MTKIFLLDDDNSVIQILKIIIEDKNLGKICYTSTSPVDACEMLTSVNPDIVIVDLLMDEMDGIAFVKKAKELIDTACFIMLSQVSSKDMIGQAYDAGIEFFIQKPINSIEVIHVIEKVRKMQELERTVDSVKSLVASENPSSQTTTPPAPVQSAYRNKLQRIVQNLGISGERGTDELIDIVCYFCQNKDQLNLISLSDICRRFSDSPKSMEQRIRRAAASGLSNISHLGLDDYGNEVFERYASSLFKFEQVRKEMNYIKGTSNQHGNVQIKKFIAALVNESME